MGSPFDDAFAACDQELMNTFGQTSPFWVPGLDPTKDPPSGECQADLIENYEIADSEGYPRNITVIDLPDLLFAGTKPDRGLRLGVSGRVYRLLKRLKRSKNLETWEVA